MNKTYEIFSLNILMIGSLTTNEKSMQKFKGSRFNCVVRGEKTI